MNDTELRAALDELKQSQRPQTTSNSKTAAGSETDADAPRAIGYAPVFYPGTTDASQAAVIPLGKSEERAGIDFQLQYVPTATIRGSVITPVGVSPEYIRVNLIATSDVILSGNGNESRTTSVTEKGEFSFLNVPPGAYTMIAKGTRGPTANASMFWATTELVVDGQSQQEIALSLQPGLTVSGRVVFDGRTPPPDPSRIRVTLLPVLSAGQVSLGTAAVLVDAGGRFTITGITAARYRVQASISGPSGWMLATSVVSGRDVLDTPLDLRQSVDGAVVTFTDRPGELSGVVRDSAGKPMAAHTVILFAAERTLWTPMSRRIRAVPSTTDGRFLFRMVAPGEYWLAAVADVDDGEWYDPVLLERLLTGSAVKTTISEGEKKTLDVRIPSPCKATDLGDRNVVRCSLEGILSALTDLVERHVHPGHQRAERNREPCHVAGEESRDAIVQSIEFIDDAEGQQGGEAPDEDLIDRRVLSRVRKVLDPLRLALLIEQVLEGLLHLSVVQHCQFLLCEQIPDRPALCTDQPSALVLHRCHPH